MSKIELINLEGLRIDGRRPNELRKFNSKLGILNEADGSAYLELGNTKLLVSVYGPHEARKSGGVIKEGAILTVEINVSPFSTSERQKRSKNDKRLSELAIFVKQTFEPMIQTQLSSRSQIDIYIQVLQNDGGLLQSAINASCLALVHAGVPMTDYVSSTSASFIENTVVLDPNQFEMNHSRAAEVTVAISPLTGKVVLLEIGHKLHVEQFKPVLEQAIQGSYIVKELLDKSVRENTVQLVTNAKNFQL